jgi:hypothetical protein
MSYINDEHRFMDYQLPYERKSRRYQGDLLPEWRKAEIRDSLARAKAKLAAMTPEELAELDKRMGH